jgi:hypothetical protein
MKQSPILNPEGQPFERSRFKLRPSAVLLGLALLVQVAVAGFSALSIRAHEHTKRAHSDPDPATSSGQITTISANGGFVVFNGNQYADVPLRPANQQERASLNRAIEAWRAVLPAGFALPSPDLFDGSPQACESEAAIACANLNSGDITISPLRRGAADLDTVLMHEVGHLLGVPHIEGDPLMNAAYSVKLSRPTRQAIALALLNRKR